MAGCRVSAIVALMIILHLSCVCKSECRLLSEDGRDRDLDPSAPHSRSVPWPRLDELMIIFLPLVILIPFLSFSLWYA